MIPGRKRPRQERTGSPARRTLPLPARSRQLKGIYDKRRDLRLEYIGKSQINLNKRNQKQKHEGSLTAILSDPRDGTVLLTGVDDQFDKLAVDRRRYCQFRSTDDDPYSLSPRAYTFLQLS